MKKLISLLAALAVVTTGTVAFAAETTTEVDVTNKVNATNVIAAGEDGLYNVTASSTADQATILAIKGKTIKVGAIQYINQAPTTEGAATFSFALNDALLTNETSAAITDDVYVLTGGDGNVTGAGYIDVTPEENTGYTVSGTVVDPAIYETIYSDFADAGLDEDVVNGLKAIWTPKVSLFAYDETVENLSNYLMYYYDGSVDKPTPLAEATVDPITGAYSFENIEAGKYSLVIERTGALLLMSYVDVEANTVVPTKTLINGNINHDVAVDDPDVNIILDLYGSSIWNEDPNYAAEYDIAPDGSLDDPDINVMLENYGSAMQDYNEVAINDVYECLGL